MWIVPAEIIKPAAFLVATVVAALVVERLGTRSIARFCARVRIEKHIENALKLVWRIAVGGAAIACSLGVLGLSIEWFVGASALTGAVIGFASRQTLGNLLAGLYIIVVRPFEVKDYVRIGGVEGQVEEISISYTKIYTPSYATMEIPNTQVLGSRITNYTKGDLIDYAFEVSFPHAGSPYEEVERCIASAIEDVYEEYKERVPRRPEFSALSLDRLMRAFLIRVFVPRGEADLLFDVQSRLIRLVTDRWDAYRSKA